MDKNTVTKLTHNEELNELWGPPNMPILFSDEDWTETPLFADDKMD